MNTTEHMTKKNKHLTFDDRCTIEAGLKNRLSFKAIAKILGKNCTTISKEIKNHFIFAKKGAPYRRFNDCIHRFNCYHLGDLCEVCTQKKKLCCSNCVGCTNTCPDYAKEECPDLKKPPYVCNGCSNRSKCTLEKHLYYAKEAHSEYREVLSESRSGFNVTEEEIAHLDSVISPLLLNGQSLQHILANNQECISCCLKTAYIYADNGLFSARNGDMPRVVRFRQRKKKSIPLKVDKACRINRTYQDFEKYHSEHPEIPVVEIDSVEGTKGGAVLLTIHFVLQKFQLAFLREANTSKSVTDIFNDLYERLGKERYKKLFPILLGDNGTEFSNPSALEYHSENEQCSHVFYCNASSPNEKGSCEVNHEFIRRLIPKGVDIGKYNQDQISLMMDHINSYGRPELGMKSPYEMFEFYYGKEILDLLNVHFIQPNNIILKPSLFNSGDNVVAEGNP